MYQTNKKTSLIQSKSPIEYTSYKYENIQSEWIIHQSYLKYLYNTKIFGDSQFETYLVVLTRIPIENFEIYDQCNRIIESTSKYFLFELKFINNEDKTEIFGAKDIFQQQIRKSNNKDNVYQKWKKKTNYFSSCQDYTKRNVLYNHQQYLSCSITQSDSEFSSSKVEPIEHVQSSISKNAEHYLSYIQLQSNDNSKLFQEKRLVWNDIFYRNEHDDYQSILTRTHEYGTFLIRPQSKKSSSSDHDY
ncbi:unnamed protein product, partial [Rotaria sordida]